MKHERLKRTAAWTARVLAAALLLGVLALGFGTSSSDMDKMRAFADAVDQWQHDPDFRQVEVVYVDLGSAAVRTHVAGAPSNSAIVMSLRSLPGLPEHLRVNPTSLAHYQSFYDGPLSAYLHLSAEQGVPSTVSMLQNLARRETLTDTDIVNFLNQFKLHAPVAADAGAVKSVRSLIEDVDAGRGFTETDNVAGKMKLAAAKVAVSLGYSSDVDRLPPAEQREVWERLDAQIKHYDPELWRSKQVSDWLSGVWAQVYGPTYSGVIWPTVRLVHICRVAGPIALLGWIGLELRKRRKRLATTTGNAGAAIAAASVILFGFATPTSAAPRVSAPSSTSPANFKSEISNSPATPAPTAGTTTPAAIANPSDYLAHVCMELKKEFPHNRTVNIVCHGHSVPAGYFNTPRICTFDAYPHLLHKALCDAFPTAVINVTVTAIGGEASDAGAARFDRDVLALRPDVVTIDYALNDRRIGLAVARKAWVSMIEKAQAANVKVILLTPTADQHAKLDDPADPLNQHAQQIRELAAEYHVGLVDSLECFKQYIKNGGQLDEVMAQFNHPNRKGHEWVAAELLKWFPAH